MTKKEMVNYLAEHLGCMKQEAERFIVILPELITASLDDDGKCTIPGLGTFSIKTRKARAGRNPKTGETIEIPEKKTVVFKAASNLAKAIGGEAE